MADRSDITPELCRQLLRYEPETGELFWLPRAPGSFATARAEAIWNSRFCGKEAFTALSKGYRVGSLHGATVKAHRVAWAIYSGHWPDVIDHIDGDRGNNRISNLRSVDFGENMKNLTARSDAPGVHFHRPTAKWRAQVTVEGKRKHIGLFETKEDAAAAAKSARDHLGYHENHGRKM